MAIGASWPWNLSTVPDPRPPELGRRPAARSPRPGRCTAPRRGCRRSPSRGSPRAGPSSACRRGRESRRRRAPPPRATAPGCPSCATGRTGSRSPRRSRRAPTRWRAVSRMRLEATLVEHLRDEVADVRDGGATSSRGTGRDPAAPSAPRRAGARAPMPPRRRDGCPARPAAAGCGSPSRTIDARGPADRDDVGERQLARLVDEEDVERRLPCPAARTASSFRRRPDASRPPSAGATSSDFGGQLDARRRAMPDSIVPLLDDAAGRRPRAPPPRPRVDEVRDRLVGRRRDPDPLARLRRARRSSARPV